MITLESIFAEPPAGMFNIGGIGYTREEILANELDEIKLMLAEQRPREVAERWIFSDNEVHLAKLMPGRTFSLSTDFGSGKKFLRVFAK